MSELEPGSHTAELPAYVAAPAPRRPAWYLLALVGFTAVIALWAVTSTLWLVAERGARQASDATVAKQTAAVALKEKELAQARKEIAELETKLAAAEKKQGGPPPFLECLSTDVLKKLAEKAKLGDGTFLRVDPSCTQPR